MTSKRLGSFAAVLLFLILILAGQALGNIIRVKWDSPSDGPGNDWNHAYHIVASAITASASGDELWVARGTYVRQVVVKSGVALYGGFAGNESSRNQRNWTSNITILDGNQATSTVTLQASDPSTRIDGFSIRNGKAASGGGIWCSGSVTVANNVVTGNIGGGIYVSSGTPTICNNVVTSNFAYSGGGVYCGGGNPVVTNNTIIGNSATQNGGGLYSTTSVTFGNNIVAFNSSGIYQSGSANLRNNCVYNPGGYNYSGISPSSTDKQADPKLTSLAYGDVHLQPDSPCIDAGYDGFVQSGWTDIDGETRIRGAHVDIGADESDGLTHAFTPPVIRVSLSGNDANDGSTWALAKRTVQAGINAASPSGGEVWIAAGIYAERITMKNGAFVFGGFAGDEVARSERSSLTAPTVLDGSAGGYVVTARYLGCGTCGIDSCTIRNGTTGISCEYASPVIANNTITANTGSGIACSYSAPTIEWNTISQNSSCGISCSSSSPIISGNSICSNRGGNPNFPSSSYYGIAISCSGGSPTISGNTITSNVNNVNPDLYSAAVYCSGTSGTITGNSISQSTDYGVLCEGSATTSIANNNIYSNRRAGIYCLANGLLITGNTLVANGYSGLAISASSVVALNNKVIGNGAGINCMGASSLVIANNTVCGNSGYGIQCGNSAMICNNTVVGNCLDGYAAVICTSGTVANNLVAYNSSGISGSSSVAVRNNCVYNPGGTDYIGVAPGTGDLRIDPKLVSAEYGQFHLMAGSPCIDAGSDTDVGSGWTDMDGKSRRYGTHVDIGADEYDGTNWTCSPTVVYVSPSGDDLNDGSSWGLAKRTVPAGLLAAALHGGECWVAAGTYTGRIVVPAYARLYGGFAGTETGRDQRDVAKNETVLDGGSSGSVVRMMTGQKMNVSCLDGFTIRNGGVNEYEYAGGVSCVYASPTISNNKITGNVGAGVYLSKSYATVQNNAIMLNTPSGVGITASLGGGILCADSCPVISGNLISANKAGQGAGINLICQSAPTGTVEITNNTISANVSQGVGGGIANTKYNNQYSASTVINSNVISQNTSTSNGAGIYSSGTDRILGNVIAGNQANVSGGGLYCSGAAPVTNNTFVGNTAKDGGALYGYGVVFSNNIVAFNSSGIYGNPSAVLRNNCFYNPPGYNYRFTTVGVGDISTDPLFANRAGGDHHLRATSPCIDADWNSATGIPTTDMDGEARVNGVVDIGADEYWAGVARTVADAKSAADASQVNIYGGIVTAAFGDSFYIEADDRTAGMLVRKQGHLLKQGDRASVVGSPATDSNSERYIEATAADSTGSGSVSSLGMANRSVGGGDSGFQSGVWGWTFTADEGTKSTRVWDKLSGLNNIGLLITTCGKVTGIEPVVDPQKPSWFTIDDGSDLSTKCTVPAGVTIDPTWQRVRVTGISSCEKAGSELHAIIKLRSQTDITAL